MESRALMIGRNAKLKLKKNWKRIPIIVTLHHDGCYLALRKMQLFTEMVATLHLDGCFFAWFPPTIFLEAKYPTFFFLILNELHSAAENFTLLTRMNYILYEKALLSLLEYT